MNRTNNKNTHLLIKYVSITKQQTNPTEKNIELFIIWKLVFSNAKQILLHIIPNWVDAFLTLFFALTHSISMHICVCVWVCVSSSLSLSHSIQSFFICWFLLFVCVKLMKTALFWLLNLISFKSFECLFRNHQRNPSI